MKGSPRTISLTTAGYRITDLIRAGAVNVDDEPPPRRREPKPKPELPRCPVCQNVPRLTPDGLVRAHRVSGRECRGTGRQVAR